MRSIYSNVLQKATGRKKFSPKSSKPVSARSKIPGFESKMVINNNGGYSFKITPMQMLNRFLIFGTESTTVTTDKNQLTLENTKNIQQVLLNNPKEAIDLIEYVSTKGQSFNNDAALFALAIACAHPKTEIRSYAFSKLNSVARIGTHLFHFVTFLTSVRGWSRMSRTAIANWYLQKDVKNMIYQILKYQSRDGMSHKDVIVMSHPKTKSPVRNAVFDWVVNGKDLSTFKDHKKEVDPGTSDLVSGFLTLRDGKKYSDKQVASLIQECGLSREMVPTEYLNKPVVQEALLYHMKPEAMLRNIAGMTSSGLVTPLSQAEKYIISTLTDEENLKNARMHPLKVLVALRTYSQGHGFKGSLSWTPNKRIEDALDKAFYKCFDYLEPCGKNFYVGVDVSGSMSGSFNDKPLKYNEVAGCIAMALLKSEPNVYVKGFESKLVDLGLSETDSLVTVVQKLSRFRTGSTNAGAPIEDAIANNIDVDCFVHITDNDFNSGKQPARLIAKYRKTMKKPNCKIASLAMYPSSYVGFAPGDDLGLDIAGFSTDAPAMLTAFAAS